MEHTQRSLCRFRSLTELHIREEPRLQAVQVKPPGADKVEEEDDLPDEALCLWRPKPSIRANPYCAMLVRAEDVVRRHIIVGKRVRIQKFVALVGRVSDEGGEAGSWPRAPRLAT